MIGIIGKIVTDLGDAIVTTLGDSISAIGDVADRTTWVTRMRTQMPPWLRRRVGGAITSGIGDAIESEAHRVAESVALRFPRGQNVSALALIGRDRKILRGPGEDSVTYASRLRAWRTAHQTRGGAFALLEQLHAYFLASIGREIFVLGGSGTVHRVDASGSVSRLPSTGPIDVTDWAQFVVVIDLPTDFFPVPITKSNGEPVLDASGNPTFTLVPIGAMTQQAIDVACAVPREWSAAHIDKIQITLGGAGAMVWGALPDESWGSGPVWLEGIGTQFAC